MRFKKVKLREIIEEQGRTRKWLAKQMGLSHGTFLHYINDHSRPGASVAPRLAKILNVNVNEIAK